MTALGISANVTSSFSDGRYNGNGARRKSSRPSGFHPDGVRMFDGGGGGSSSTRGAAGMQPSAQINDPASGTALHDLFALLRTLLGMHETKLVVQLLDEWLLMPSIVSSTPLPVGREALSSGVPHHRELLLSGSAGSAGGLAELRRWLGVGSGPSEPSSPGGPRSAKRGLTEPQKRGGHIGRTISAPVSASAVSSQQKQTVSPDWLPPPPPQDLPPQPESLNNTKWTLPALPPPRRNSVDSDSTPVEDEGAEEPPESVDDPPPLVNGNGTAPSAELPGVRPHEGDDDTNADELGDVDGKVPEDQRLTNHSRVSWDTMPSVMNRGGNRPFAKSESDNSSGSVPSMFGGGNYGVIGDKVERNSNGSDQRISASGQQRPTRLSLVSGISRGTKRGSAISWLPGWKPNAKTMGEAMTEEEEARRRPSVASRKSSMRRHSVTSILDKAAVKVLGENHAIVVTLRGNSVNSSEMWFGKASHSYLLHPSGAIRMTWDIMALCLILVEAILVPFTICFDTSGTLEFTLVSTVFFAADIALNFLTGYYKDGILVMKQHFIVFHYVKGWLAIDVLSTFPWFLVSSDGDDGNSNNVLLRFAKVGKFLRMMKLLRVAKVSMLLTAFEDILYSPPLIIGVKLARILSIIFMMTHWTACAWGWLGHPSRVRGAEGPHDRRICEPDGPCEPGVDGSPWRRRYGLDEDSVANQYLHALRFSAGLFTGADIGIQPGFWAERVFVVTMMFTSFIALSTIISKVVIMFNKINQEHACQDELMMQFKEFMAASKVPLHLQAKVRRYLEYQFKARRQLQARRFELLDRLSPWIRKELTVHLNRNVLTQHPFFSDMPLEVQPHICCSGASLLCAPGDVVMQIGQSSSFMYFLMRGNVQVTTEADGDVPEEAEVPLEEDTRGCVISAPGYFGGRGLFATQILKMTVRCVTHVELLKITKDEIESLQREFPALRAYMQSCDFKQQSMEDPLWECSMPILGLDDDWEEDLTQQATAASKHRFSIMRPWR